jgi:hypothetical protein
MNERLPVTVAVSRPDGTVEHVRVGWAVKQGTGFSISLGELTIGAGVGAGVGAAPEARRPAPPPASSAGGAVFPPYGRSKGAPIAGASLQDLEFYAAGARRTLGDPAKSRWHEKERQLLATIEAEIARQGGAPPPRGDDDAPPPFDDPF